jgi:hypothetical protein
VSLKKCQLIEVTYFRRSLFLTISVTLSMGFMLADYTVTLFNSKVFFERLAVAQLVKEFPALNGTRIIITIFT